MAESYSVKAILSAQDKNFTSTMNGARGAAEGLGNKIKSGLGFGILTGIGQSAFATITSGIANVVSELSSSSAAWKTFEGNMQMFGKSTGEIKNVKKELQDFATQTIYSASDMASTYSQLEAVGTKNTNKLVKGFGGLAAAAENPTQAMKTLSVQATQMAAKPKVAWMDFKLMLEQTPAGLAAVAKGMGMTTSELVSSVQSGTIATQDFFDAIAKVGTNDAFTKLATEYKTVDQAMDGLTETMGTKLGPAFDAVSQIGIDAISGIVDKMGGIDADGIATSITGMVNTVKPYWNALSGALGEAGAAVWDLAITVGGMVGDFLSSQSTIDTFTAVVTFAGDAVATLANFINDNSDVIAKATPIVLGLVAGYKGFKIVNGVVGSVQKFSKGIMQLTGNAVTKIAPNLLTTAAAEATTGAASSASATQVLAAAVAFLALGAGVALICAGFFILVQSAIALANAGPMAVVALVGLTLAIAGLAIGAALLGPALTVGAVGFIAFGAAIALVGVGALLASVALLIISAVLPSIITYGASGAIAIAQLSISMLAFGAGATIAGAGAIILAAGLTVLGVGATVAAVGVLLLGVAFLVLGAGLALCSVGAVIIAPTLAIIGVNASVASIGMLALGAATLVFGAGAIAGTAGAIALAAAFVVFGASLLVVTVGMVALAAGLLGVLGSMKSIQSSAKSTEKSLKAMKSSISFVNSALDGLGSLAKSAMSSLFNAFSNAESKVKSAGKNIGEGASNGVRSGLSNMPAVAATTLVQTITTLTLGRAGAQQAGVFIGQGLGEGMASQLGYVRSVATSLAAEAEKAIRAKAQIHSPSRVSGKLGTFWGQGWINNIKNMIPLAKKTIEELVAIPTIDSPKLSFAGNHGNSNISEEYSYYNDAEYTFNSMIQVDGREFAGATATYTKEELERQENIKNRIKGVR